MAILQTGIVKNNNVKTYQCFTTDATQNYPTDCGASSTMKVINPTTKEVVRELYYNGTDWCIDTTAGGSSSGSNGAMEFEISVEITRPANTTAYTIGDLINGTGATELPTLDFGSANADKKIQINSAVIFSNNGAAATKLNATLQLFNAATLTGQSVDDNGQFTPSYDEIKVKSATFLEGLYNLITYGSSGTGPTYGLFQAEILRNAKLNNSGKLFAAIVATNAYTPASGEKFYLTLKGYIL